LGKGAFSVVKLATRKEDGAEFAVKVIDKKNVQQDLDRLQTEIDILKKVKHANIIALEDLFETSTHFYIITELVTGGELFDMIVEKGNYSEADAALLVQKMLSAIDYLHHLGIVHRDLKPENLLLKDSSDICEVKLADFGLSKIVGQAGMQMMMTACGTPGYVAPEVLQAMGYGPEVDLWSIGVITYILLCGFPPFYHEELPQLFDQIMEADFSFPPEYWDPISAEAKDFISKLLVVASAERLDTTQALAHPWLKLAQKNTNPLSKMGSKLGDYVKVRKANSKILEGSLQF
jgi:calcium/calmodulin-dependent protein kinase I